MQLRLEQIDWPRQVWKVVKNPAVEVIAAIVVMLLAAWVVVQTEAENRVAQVPVLSGVK